jgi:hypothetical protein
LTEQHSAGPVAVITGASSGIGAATARTLAGHGYRLALLARRVELLEQLAAELGPGTLAIPADVADRHAVVPAASRIELDLGCADVLINNAGVMLLGPFGSGQREEARPASRRRRRPGQHLLRRGTDRQRRQRRLRGDEVGDERGRRPCGKSCSPRSASPSSNPVRWQPNSPTTSPTRLPNKAPNSSTQSWPSPPDVAEVIALRDPTKTNDAERNPAATH